MQFTSAIAASYAASWSAMKVVPSRLPQLESIANKIIANRAPYEEVQAELGIPWWWIAIINERESSGNLSTYLGNGEPLNRVTQLVPRGRGPFSSWKEGAVDALKLQGLDKWKDWSIEGSLYQAEAYNGWGYLGKTNSPYIWSWTDRYTQGKYVADGRYSASTVDPQPGFAAILWQLVQMGAVSMPEHTKPPEPSPDVKWVQSALNKLGANLAVDGFAGVQTTAAIKSFQEEHDLAPDGIVGSATRTAIEQELKSQEEENDPMGSWIATILLNALGNSQVQSLFRKALTIVGTALLVKLGLDPSSAGSIIGQVITALGGVVALGSSVYLSAQNASPSVSNPTLVKPAE